MAATPARGKDKGSKKVKKTLSRVLVSKGTRSRQCSRIYRCQAKLAPTTRRLEALCTPIQASGISCEYSATFRFRADLAVASALYALLMPSKIPFFFIFHSCAPVFSFFGGFAAIFLPLSFSAAPCTDQRFYSALSIKLFSLLLTLILICL